MVVLAQVQQLLSHAHIWVQLIACKLFGRLFNTYKITTKAITEANSFLSVDPAKKVCHVCKSVHGLDHIQISELVISFCGQLRSPDVTDELALQVMFIIYLFLY